MSSISERHAAAQAAWGDDEPEPRVWNSGPWSFELRGDEVADLRFDGSVVLRGVKAVIRDRNWGTVASQAVAVVAHPDSLEVELRFSGLGGEFSGVLRVSAEQDELRIVTALHALVPFERNRAGLVVLLPADAAASPLRVRHPDGTSELATLPGPIAPHQPALDIEGLEWSGDGVDVMLAFHGDVFEMEDQRNWTDASFKVYSTPLSRPFPVAVAAGTVISQTLELRATRAASSSVAVAAGPIALLPSGRRVPAIGTSASTGPDPLAGTATDPGVLLVELDLAAANWRPALARAVAEAGDAPLDIRFISDDPGAIDAAVAELAPLAPARLGVYSPVTHVTEEVGWRALTTAVAASGIGAELVGGTRAHFTELNRNHDRLPADLPALTFSSTPQMHAHERAQLVESIAMQRLTAQDAVRIATGRPVHIGPVTLRPRFNAVATTAPPAEPADLAHGYGPAHLDDRPTRGRALERWRRGSSRARPRAPCRESRASATSRRVELAASTDSRSPRPSPGCESCRVIRRSSLTPHCRPASGCSVPTCPAAPWPSSPT